MDRSIYDNYIVQIVKHGSLSKAAASLGITQPALSSGLTALENKLGFKIFNRKKIPISFTPEGEIYFDYINKIQILSKDYQQRIDNYRESVGTKVIIGGPVAYVESIVADAVVHLRQDNPNYKVSVKCSPLSELIDMASKGEINCFISTSEEIPANFEKRLIGREKVYLCIPASNPVNQAFVLNKNTGTAGEDYDYSLLDGEDFIFLEEGQPLHEQMEDFFREYHINPAHHVTVNQVSVAVKLSIKGEGICIASEYALEGNGDLDNLCIYPLSQIISGRSIYIAYNKELFMPEACAALIKYIENKNI